MAEVGEILNRLADELANVSAVLGTHTCRSLNFLKGTVKRFNLCVWLNCFITLNAKNSN